MIRIRTGERGDARRLSKPRAVQGAPRCNPRSRGTSEHIMDAKQVLEMIKEHDVKYVDLRFTDPRGKWQHTARTSPPSTKSSFSDGIMFDGSSIAGWKAINESDMILMPDPDTAVMDPFAAQPTLIVFCDVHRALDRPALRPRPALHRQEGRGLPEVVGHRRHRLFRSRGRVLRVRRRRATTSR